jgi:predicted phosphate transport protein (TIGR00153 family)
MFKLTPTNTQFYDFFDAATDVLVRATERFRAGLNPLVDPQQLAEEITALEHEGDELTHETMEMLHKTFITPLERADIRRLIVTLDDVLDALDDAARRLALYEIHVILPEVQDLAAVLVEASKAVQQAVHQLRFLRKRNGILQHCVEVHRLEDEGDRIYHQMLAGLFKSGMDPSMIIKWKDIIEDLENSIDSCQDVSVVVEGIVLENS